MTKNQGFDQPGEAVIYTDGACRYNGRLNAKAAWAWLIVSRGQELAYEAGPLLKGVATNNRAEMAAVGHALRGLQALLEIDGKVLVLSDSRYVIDGLTKWLAAWKRNGWKTADGAPVKNRREWEWLDRTVSSFKERLRFRWVKGHDGDLWNTRVDVLSGRVMNPRYIPSEFLDRYGKPKPKWHKIKRRVTKH